ncbi:MAG: Dph6-related ATP pyrophosphatase, partial [Planctomycetota bacterium]
TQLAREMVSAGLRAHVTCVDTQQLDPSFAGRIYDPQFLDHLPAGIDPCGEHGEFHTFVYDAPIFNRTINVHPGQIAQKNEFVYVDMVE